MCISGGRVLSDVSTNLNLRLVYWFVVRGHKRVWPAILLLASLLHPFDVVVTFDKITKSNLHMQVSIYMRAFKWLKGNMR
jgi:hypothetical protein